MSGSLCWMRGAVSEEERRTDGGRLPDERYWKEQDGTRVHTKGQRRGRFRYGVMHPITRIEASWVFCPTKELNQVLCSRLSAEALRPLQPVTLNAGFLSPQMGVKRRA